MPLVRKNGVVMMIGSPMLHESENLVGDGVEALPRGERDEIGEEVVGETNVVSESCGGEEGAQDAAKATPEGEADRIGEEARGQANVVSNVDVADVAEVRSPLRRSKRRQIRLEEEAHDAVEPMPEGEANQIGEEARGQSVDVADATAVCSPLRRSKRRQNRLEEEADVAVEESTRREIGQEEEEALGETSCGGEEEAHDEAQESGVDVTDAVEVRAPLRRSKRRRIRDEEEEDLEAEVPALDEDDDCAVQGDEDCDEVDDAVDTNREEDDTAGLGVEEDGNLDMERDFPEANGEEEASDNDRVDDIWDEDKIPDPLSSDDEDDDRVEAARNDLGDPEILLALEKTYNSPEDFKLALLMYSLKTRYDIKLYNSEAMVVAAKCVYVSDEGVECPCRVRCSYEKRKHKMQIRTYYNEHTCVRSGHSKMLKVSSNGFLFEERLRVNPKLTKHEMVAEILREYKLEVTPDQCAKAKTKVLRARRASHDSHFARIWDYQAEVLLRNPGTEFNIETVAGAVIGSKQRFYRLYICFQAQRESWKQTCRPVIGIDGAFLKWDIKGHLLAAVGRDGDNRIVPIAWSVVEIENDDNWDWFLRQLSTSLGLCEMTDLAIISDKQSVSLYSIRFPSYIYCNLR